MLGGSELGKSKGKELITASVTGLIIILGSYGLLTQINPELTKFKTIQPPELTDPCPGGFKEGDGNGCTVDFKLIDNLTKPISGSGIQIPGGNGGQILQIALAEKGNAETGKNSGPQIEKYFKPNGKIGEAWCAYFATWVYGQAGYGSIGNMPGRGGSATSREFFKKANGREFNDRTANYTIYYAEAIDVFPEN